MPNSCQIIHDIWHVFVGLFPMTWPPFPFLRVKSKFLMLFSCWNLPFSVLNSQHLTQRSSSRISPSGWSGRWTPAARWRHGGIVVMARVPSIKPQIMRSKSTIKMAAWTHRIYITVKHWRFFAEKKAGVRNMYINGDGSSYLWRGHQSIAWTVAWKKWLKKRWFMVDITIDNYGLW